MTVAGLEVSTFTIPTDAPESNGTLEWDSTTRSTCCFVRATASAA
jgi:hypothetical protein